MPSIINVVVRYRLGFFFHSFRLVCTALSAENCIEISADFGMELLQIQLPLSVYLFWTCCYEGSPAVFRYAHLFDKDMSFGWGHLRTFCSTSRMLPWEDVMNKTTVFCYVLCVYQLCARIHLWWNNLLISVVRDYYVVYFYMLTSKYKAQLMRQSYKRKRKKGLKRFYDYVSNVSMTESKPYR